MREAGRQPVRLSPAARRVALEVMVEALQFRNCEVRIACVDDHHFHILMRLPKEATAMKPTHGNGWGEGTEPTHSHAWVSSEQDNYLPEVRALVGSAKRRAARALSEKGLVAPGGVWATRMHMTRIVDQEHGAEVIAYIREHTIGDRDGALWEHETKAE
jgi:REP element-mobilizing transposase RayT